LARTRFGLAPFRSPLLRPLLTSSGYVRCFSSPAYPHPDYVFIRGSPGSPPDGVPPFGDPRLTARARLPEAFRCYATSFIGTGDLGIHPTPSVTVSPDRRPGSPPSPSRRARPLPPRRPQPRRQGSLLLSPRSSNGKVRATVPGCCVAMPRSKQQRRDRKKMVEMRRLELLTPSVQRRCSPN
jgi:hypothetical protein